MWSCLWDFAGVWVEDGCIQPQLRVWNETLHSLCSSHGLIGSKSVYFFVPPYATCPLHRRRSGNMSTASAPAFVSQNAPHMQRILYHLESSCIVLYPCSDMFRMTEYSSLPIRLVVQSINLVAEGVAPDKSRLAPHDSVALIHAFHETVHDISPRHCESHWRSKLRLHMLPFWWVEQIVFWIQGANTEDKGSALKHQQKQWSLRFDQDISRLDRHWCLPSREDWRRITPVCAKTQCPRRLPPDATLPLFNHVTHRHTVSRYMLIYHDVSNCLRMP